MQLPQRDPKPSRVDSGYFSSGSVNSPEKKPKNPRVPFDIIPSHSDSEPVPLIESVGRFSMGEDSSVSQAQKRRGHSRPLSSDGASRQPVTAALTQEDVCGFTQLWEKEFGERLPNDEAKERAEKLVHFVLLMQRMGF